MNFSMTESELSLLRTQLGKCTNYLEYGAGYSTELAVSIPTVERIDVVESDRGFVEETLLTQDGIAHAVKQGRLNFHFVDIGPIKGWGRPADRNRKHIWPAYCLAPFVEQREYDLILVDGIFRGACALTAFLSAPETPVLIHDFWPRPRYHFLLTVACCVEKTDTFALFRRRRRTRPEQLREMLKRHQYLVEDERTDLRVTAAIKGLIGHTALFHDIQRIRQVLKKDARTP